MAQPSKYRCPGCESNVDKSTQRHYRLGPWFVHRWCAPQCDLCEKTITAPPVGSAWKVAAWCGKPVHQDCKTKEMTAAMEAGISHGEDES
jgi:hypothetical protein